MTWFSGLSPEMQTFLPGRGASFATGLVCNFTTSLLQSAGGKMRGAFKKPERLEALHHAAASALEAALAGWNLDKEEARARTSRLERPSITDAIKDPSRRGVVILGDPGSGKTTLLQHVSLTLAKEPDEKNTLPIFLPFAAYDDYLNRETPTPDFQSSFRRTPESRCDEKFKCPLFLAESDGSPGRKICRAGGDATPRIRNSEKINSLD